MSGRAPSPSSASPSCLARSYNARPQVETGDYVRTLPVGKTRCVAYTAPPSVGGARITSISQGTYLGPVGLWEQTPAFTSVEVRGYWVNVWASQPRPKLFASVVPREVVNAWIAPGWSVWEDFPGSRRRSPRRYSHRLITTSPSGRGRRPRPRPRHPPPSPPPN